MSTIPDDLMYTRSHEWVRDEGDGIYTIGISDHAQGSLGDLVFVEPAEVGNKVAAGDTCCVVESVKAASDVYSPLDGAIEEVNTDLDDSPELINSDPYGDGWLFRLRADDPEAFSKLMDSDAYAELLAAEDS